MQAHYHLPDACIKERNTAPVSSKLPHHLL
jgi:hypothetical protein